MTVVMNPGIPGDQSAESGNAGAQPCLRVRKQIGWVLRVNRLFGHDGQWAKASMFAAAFKGGCWPGTANESKISRWETAALRIPYQSVRRYEELLGLTPGLLSGTADNVHAYYCPDPDCPGANGWSLPRNGPVPVDRVNELIDKASSDGLMTGHEWDELTREISSEPNFFIAPSAAWATLAERLLQEQIIADRVAWLQRSGAFLRLLSHPVGQRSAIAACISLATDRTNQVGIEVIGALDASRHPDANRQVLAQLACPTSDKTFYGALLACVRKVARGHFTQEQVRFLASVVVGLLGDCARHDDARTLAASLLRQMPHAVPASQASKMRTWLTEDETVGQILTTGRLGAPRAAAGRVRRIVSAATAQLPREAFWVYDETLDRLVDELLFSPVADVRLCASFLIHATPYREPVASALATELSGIAAVQTDLAICIMDALRLLGGPAERSVVERLTLTPGIPAPVVASAARNIGHLGGTSDDTYWVHAFGRQRDLLNRGASPAGGAILRGLVYGLGMSWNDPLLTRIRDLGDMPWQAREAASWWLGHPQRIRESAAC
jgi:hypothetical protein